MQHIIDTDAIPKSMRPKYNPDVLQTDNSVKEHLKLGPIEWSLDVISLETFSTEREECSLTIPYRKLIESGKKLMNANVLDYLLEHPELIPDEWKGKIIYFLGTTYSNYIPGYCNYDGLGDVRYLWWGEKIFGDKWLWSWAGIRFSGTESINVLVHTG